MLKKTTLSAGALALLMGMGSAQAGWDWGGDLRVRVTDLDSIPTQAGGFQFDLLFNRTRTRLWAGYQFNEDVAFHGRLMNEFRIYERGEDRSRYEDQKFLSEVVPDLLYMDFNNLADGLLDLRVGRQELIYGTGNIILNGTPLDGSRSLFFNAVKAGLTVNEGHTLDLLAIYNARQDALTINRQSGLSLIEHNERAMGVYGRNSQSEAMPFEYYWIYKEELGSRTADGSKADADFHTLGVRFMPRNGPISANLELAAQDGSHGDANLKGRLLDASLTLRPAIWGQTRPAFTAGYYYLSGNEAGTGDNEAWYPVFSRWPQFSELYVYSYVGTQFSIAGWTNLKAPFIGLDLNPSGNTSLKLRAHRLYADEKDGSGDGDHRGDLFTAVLGINLSPSLRAHLWAEYLDTGDYYPSGTSDAHFLRANVEYTF
ncbi:alginate export family protein [Ectothiorhodospira shaposhnikovii]|uniref:alginate export family protein n=1 Tax=Ectothiorhodospira shaposhnikovii TaxID=1054 RepID=UPI001EE98232|nr:alginate export family protein [Ectothiorhodospira shaposhnikovii]MCG5513961.1 alginate export family protein [Ectothiorhodospira shaposhnikovii]